MPDQGAATLAARIEFDDYDQLVETYFENGWTDGLPIVPPTPDKVARFLAVAGLDPADVIGTVPTREVTVTAELAAANAVMAGCKPEYFPAVVAALRAHLSVLGNSHSTTGTLAGAAQCVIINGPVRLEIGAFGGQGALGPGFRANATIGRALRLVIRNVCRSIPGFLDRASFSSPMRYSFCFGENEEEGAPWVPLHVQRGFAPTDSTATVASVTTMVACGSSGRTPEEILDDVIAVVRPQGSMLPDKFLGDAAGVVLIIGFEHMRYIHAAGWSKAQVQEYLYPRFTAPTTAPHDRLVWAPSPENILLVAAGGVGVPQTQVLLPHLSAPLTERIQPAVA